MISQSDVIKYKVIPGYVLSKTDGDSHYIKPQQLVDLYRLPPGSYVIGLWEYTAPGDVTQEFWNSLIPCRPRYDGNYPAYDAD